MHAADRARERRRQRDARGSRPRLRETARGCAPAARRARRGLRGLSTVKSYQSTPPPGLSQRHIAAARRCWKASSSSEENTVDASTMSLLPERPARALASPQRQLHRVRQARPRRRMALGQQLDAGEMLGREAEPQQLEQVAAAAAADLEQAQRARGRRSRAGRTARSIARWRSCIASSAAGLVRR